MPGEPPQSPPLVFVHRRLGGRHRPRRPCLHLNKADRIALPRHQVKIASRNPRALSARGNSEPLAPPVEEGRSLAATSCRQMLGLCI
jgi:hypothetical protein